VPALIFDYDGLMVDSERVLAEAVVAAVVAARRRHRRRRHRPPLRHDGVRRRVGPLAADVV
jgi:beta-phosphoglucomutase-like phosphatase (HAD superfamily)